MKAFKSIVTMLCVAVLIVSTSMTILMYVHWLMHILTDSAIIGIPLCCTIIILTILLILDYF